MKQYFSIDKRSGLVSSRVSFDYEQLSDYSLHVLVSNPGSGLSNSTRLNIHITGVNEDYPRFQQPVFQFAVSESSVEDTFVGQIRALDQDQGRDGEVLYFLIGSSSNRGFKIDKRTE